MVFFLNGLPRCDIAAGFLLVPKSFLQFVIHLQILTRITYQVCNTTPEL